MKVSISSPSTLQLDQFLAIGKNKPPSYLERFDTQSDFQEKRRTAQARNYNYDENAAFLGKGHLVFKSARKMIQNWQMFPPGWTRIYPGDAPVRTGQRVALMIKLLGLWWWNSSEIQYVIDEPKRFGFAYGTLPGHVESGEELFLVEMNDRDEVWYKIKAFSRPAYKLVQLAYPFARSQQRRFVRESMELMKSNVQQMKVHE